MREEKMISILIPIYNSEKYLEELFESIKAQTFTDFEVIMIDDGSTDSTASICKKWTSTDSRFKYFYKENSGYSKTRNYALDKATGDYVFFIDSDDFMSPQTLEFLHETLTKNNLDLVACYENDFKDGSKPEIISYDAPTIKHFLNNKDYLTTLTYEDLVIARIWNKLYKRSILKDIVFRECVMEDRIFNIELSKRITKGAILDNKLIYHRFHENSVMTTVSKDIYEGMYLACKEHIVYAKRLISDEREFKGINEALISLLNRFAAGAHAEGFLEEEKKLRSLLMRFYKENGLNKLTLNLFLQIYLYPIWRDRSLRKNHIWIGGRNMNKH